MSLETQNIRLQQQVRLLEETVQDFERRFTVITRDHQAQVSEANSTEDRLLEEI